MVEPVPVSLGRRVAAALLSLVLPGAGQGILGRWQRGAGWLVIVGVAMAATAFFGPWVLGMALVLRLIAVADAFVVDPPPTGPTCGGRTLTVVALFLGATLAVSTATRAWLVEAFTLPSAAMAPTLRTGDFVFCAKWMRSFRRGDIVVYRNRQEAITAHRLIGLPGDRVEVGADGVRLNGNLVERAPVSDSCENAGVPLEPDLTGGCTLFEERLDGRRWRVAQQVRPGAQKVTSEVVPEGHGYVLGDNRDQAADSRFMGPIPLGNVLGQLRYVWFSWPQAGPDLDRIGTSFD